MEAATQVPVPAPTRTAAPPPPTHPREQTEGTAYVILERVEAKDGGQAWREVAGISHGGGSDAAIRKSRDGQKGAFKAVPVRSWKGGLELDEETRKVTVSKPLAG